MSRYHDNPAYRAAAAALKRRARAQDAPCAKCGGPIDYGVDWREPAAFTAGHRTAAALGGRHDDLEPQHRRCNLREGSAIRYAAARLGRPDPTTLDDEW